MRSVYKEAFLKNIINRAATAVKETAQYRHGAIHENNSSVIMGSLLNSAVEKGLPGAKTIRNSNNWLRRRLSDADTATGAVLAGKNWRTGSSIRSNLFTDYKENFYNVGDNPDTFKRVRVPSMTAPLKSVGDIIVPGLAMSSAFEIKDNLLGKNKENYSEGA